MNSVTWVLESEVFPKSHGLLRQAVTNAGYRLVDWRDEWWIDGLPSNLGSSIFFHGSLGNAALITKHLDWKPGSYCDETMFSCSSWYCAAHKWLLHKHWKILPAKDFVESAPEIAAELNCGNQIFVRPDSPLKPFSGRVLKVQEISLAALDYGFYFEDESLPIVAAPVVNVGQEWRFIVVGSTVVAGSSYDTTTRSAVAHPPGSGPWSFAQSVASDIPAPSTVYVLDVCECGDKLRLLELNPFGGADLYACDANIVVQAVSNHSPGYGN